MRLSRRRIIVFLGLALALMIAARARVLDRVAATTVGKRVDDIAFTDGSFTAFPMGPCTLGAGRPAPLRHRILALGIRCMSPADFIRRDDNRATRRTFERLRLIANACEAYANDKGEHPVAASPEELRARLVPEYAGSLSMVDGWGKDFSVRSGGLSYRVASRGSDGRWQGPALPVSPHGGFDGPTNRQLLGDRIRRLARHASPLGP